MSQVYCIFTVIIEHKAELGELFAFLLVYLCRWKSWYIFAVLHKLGLNDINVFVEWFAAYFCPLIKPAF